MTQPRLLYPVREREPGLSPLLERLPSMFKALAMLILVVAAIGAVIIGGLQLAYHIGGYPLEIAIATALIVLWGGEG